MRSASFLVLGFFCAVGCGASGPKRGAVEGQVLIDGRPLDAGTINFYPAEGTVGPSTGTTITNGAYRLSQDKGPIVGKNRVEIRGNRKTGKKIPDPMAMDPNKLVDEIVEAVPADYNTNSTLVRDINPGTNTHDFELPGTR
jgi:hypothetical protein